MVFWIMLIWVLVMWLFVQNSMSSDRLCADGVHERRVNTGYCILIFSVPFLFTALRSGFIDTASYIATYNNIPTDMNFFDLYVTSHSKSTIYYGLQMLFKVYISEDAQVWLTFIALIQSFCIMATLKKYSPDVGMSVFIFVASTLIGQWMLNGMRQFVAVCILFLCTDWLLKKKWFLYLLLAVFLMGLAPITSRLGMADPPWYLCGIHQATLIMILAFFCIQGKAFNVRVWVVVAALVVLIVTGGLEDVIGSSVENTDYSNEMEYVQADTGTSVLRVMVCSFPAVLALLARKEIKKESTPKIITLSANASVITAVLYIASAFTSGIFVGRLPVYTEMYNLILLPWLVKHPFKDSERILIICLVAAYIVYFYFQINDVWKGQYQSEILGIGV